MPTLDETIKQAGAIYENEPLKAMALLITALSMEAVETRKRLGLIEERLNDLRLRVANIDMNSYAT